MSAIEDIKVRQEPIELCQLLKFSSLVGTGGEGKVAIERGLVTVNGEVETRKRKKLHAGDVVVFNEEAVRVVL